MPLFIVVGRRNNSGAKVGNHSELQVKEKDRTPENGQKGGRMDSAFNKNPYTKRGVSRFKCADDMGVALTRDDTRWCHAPSQGNTAAI